jgi:two-component sensor histidine kinase
LSLVLHELATNAAKYGALSVPGGKVRVGWEVDADNLRLRWAESDGPPVSTPTKTGYGTKLIQSAITYSLRGTMEHIYAPGGLKADIAIPLKDPEAA